MTKKWWWIVGIYALIAVVTFFVITSISPGPNFSAAIFWSSLWPIFWASIIYQTFGTGILFRA